jgi:hypothetical protein
MELFIFAAGLIAGGIIMKLWLSNTTIGTLRMDTSDPEDGPYLFLELSEDIRELYRKEYVRFKVSHK